MAICEMDCISIIGSMSKLDDLINTCGESGVFQPDNISNFYSSMDNFSSILEENPYTNYLVKLKNTIYSFGAKPEDMSIDINSKKNNKIQMSNNRIFKYVNYISSTVENLIDSKRELYAKIEKNRNELEKLRHYYGLDKSLQDILSCEYVTAHFGKIPREYYSRFDEITKKSQEQGISLIFFEYDLDKYYQWGLYFTNIEDQDEINRIFSSMHFEETFLESSDKSPYNTASELRMLSSELYKKINLIEREISEFWYSQKDKCMMVYNKLKELNTYFEIKLYAMRYNESFILVGWVPKDNIRDFKKILDKIGDLEYSLESGKNLINNSPPVKLKNKRIFEFFEFFVSTYGMPSYNELDPTPFVAITYMMLFGIMFADLGQGIVVSIVGWLMWKFKNMKLGKILIPCGISSSIFGLIFGSVFGFEHALDGFYKNILGLEDKLIDVMSPSASSLIIYIAVGIGILLLVISMMLGIVSLIKKREYGEALFSPNGVSGLVFYISVIFMLLNNLIFKLNFVNIFYVILFLIIPLVCIMFKEILIKLLEKRSDWKPDSWGDFISQNFFELFEVILSYVTNTMSFLRVGSFVLVHAGMMMVVFSIAEMFTGTGYVIVLIFGNIFVIALEALLAGIQVLRLEFYEMFSRFFEGQGRAYSPVKITQEN